MQGTDYPAVFLFIAEKIYPVELGISIEASKYTWIQLLMSDEAGTESPFIENTRCCLTFWIAFYCNIALMQACNELFLGGGESSPVAISHLTNSLTYVRERLESPQALSNSTLGLVMSFITQEQVRGQHKAASIHMDGLAKMIELRGGLDSLEDCLPVVLKACKCVCSLPSSYLLADIVVALQDRSRVYSGTRQRASLQSQ